MAISDGAGIISSQPGTTELTVAAEERDSTKGVRSTTTVSDPPQALMWQTR